MERFAQDLRFGYRNLLRLPGFTAVAILSLALGIGANTAIFSFINTVLLKTLPVGQPEQLALFGDALGRGIYGGIPAPNMTLFSWKQYQAFREQNSVFSDILAVNSLPARLYVMIPSERSSGLAEPVLGSLVSGNFFDVLGLTPQIGRFFEPSVDQRVNGSPYIILSDRFWERRFHRDPGVVGQIIEIAGLTYTVTGVGPRGFFGIRLGDAPDLWLPLSMQAKMPGQNEDLLGQAPLQFAHLMGRLKTGVGLKKAEANINVIYQRILPDEMDAKTPQDFEHIRHASIRMTAGNKGASSLRGTYETPLRILMIVVALVLLIACANVANLQLALAVRRRKEFALRFAIGAGRARIVRQVITESLLLAICGGGLGILVANGAGKLLVHLISTGPRALPLDFTLDPRVLAFTALVSILTGLLFGLVPAIRSSKVDLNSSLKETKASMASPRKVTFGRALVAGQVAVSLGLLVTAGLLLHSFSNLINLGAGFDKESVLVFKLDSNSSGYKEDARLANLYQQIEVNVSRVPGVDSAGVSVFTFNEGTMILDFSGPGINLPDEERIATINCVSPGYFSAVRVPMILGRTIQPSDTAAGGRVAVVSETFARKVFGGPGNAIGRMIKLGDDNPKEIEIVGVARDTKARSVRDKDQKTVWLSIYQSPQYVNNLAVRVKGDPSQVAAAVRRVMTSTDRNLPIRWTTTLADEVSDSLVKERAIAQLSTFFAGLALLLSAVGLYGTISFAVARRTNEIGIRMALGAARTTVLSMVLRDALALAVIGMAVGLPLSLVASREMQTLLYGLSGFDAASAAGAVAALMIVVTIAGYLPARRAASVDPMVALRYE
jgi:predicted permease